MIIRQPLWKYVHYLPSWRTAVPERHLRGNQQRSNISLPQSSISNMKKYSFCVRKCYCPDNGKGCTISCIIIVKGWVRVWGNRFETGWDGSDNQVLRQQVPRLPDHTCASCRNPQGCGCCATPVPVPSNVPVLRTRRLSQTVSWQLWGQTEGFAFAASYNYL